MTRFQLSSANSKALMVGFGMIAAGGLISLCGMGVGGAAALTAARRWLLAQEEPPSIMVKRKISQAKAATTAGASAWQDGMARTH
jgi:hypothetical protein